MRTHRREAYDGCAELWFDSVEALQQAISEPAYLSIIRPDELICFDDLSMAPVLITTEHVVWEGKEEEESASF